MAFAGGETREPLNEEESSLLPTISPFHVLSMARAMRDKRHLVLPQGFLHGVDWPLCPCPLDGADLQSLPAIDPRAVVV